MRNLKRTLLIALTLLLCASTVAAFHVPPWDTGHNSFSGDPGDDDTDPGDDGPCKSGSPVELASGNFVYSARDLFVSGLGPAIDFARTYNSRDMRKGPFGNGWVFAYDERLIETSDGVQVFAICSKPNGKRDVFTKQADGSYQPPPHNRDSLVKNSDKTYTLRETTGAVRRFNADGRLVAIVDRNGNALTLAYDSTGFPTSITDASGRSVQLTKGADGRVDSVTDPASRTFRYTYDSAGNLTKVTDPLGNATTYQYDSKGNLTAVLDPRGNKVMGVAYDSKGRAGILLDGAETWTFNYLTSPQRTTKRDTSNNTWTYFYNDKGNLTKVTDPLGNSETYTYDANLNLTSLTDKNGKKTTYTHDASGNPLTITDALGNTRAFTYDSHSNRPLTVTDRVGNVTRYEYDGRGNLTKTVNPLNQSAQFQYDARGLMTAVIDPAGTTTTFTYDASGNLLKTTDPLGNGVSATYDVLGKVASVTDAEGHTTQYFYDNGERVTKVIDPRVGSTLSEYDAAGNITAVTQPNGSRTTFLYDDLSRLIKVTNPLNQSTAFTYDNQNNLLRKDDPNGQAIQYTYDALNRLTRKSKPGENVAYTYDRVGNLLTVSDSDSSVSFAFDALNRVAETRTGSSTHQPVTLIKYTYDANGNRKTMTDPSGGVTNYVYNQLSLLTSLTDSAAQTFNFTYDAASRRKQVTRGSGPTTTYGYDAASHIASMLHQSAAGSYGLNYTYDRSGQRLSMTDGGGTHAYSYDALYRLTGATHPSGSNPAESYSYDPQGNRTASHLSASYTHNAANRLTADATFNYTYDANGNLTRRTERSSGNFTSYTYDSENLLTRIDFPDGTSARYSYDGIGRRIEKNVNGQITQYVYDGQDILLEYSGGGTVEARYTHGPSVDEVLSVKRGAETYFVETDSLGSVVRVTDGANVAAAYEYNSFGKVTGQTGTTQTPYLFQGREFDQESGLYYYRARYYDPSVGRFLSEDPMAFAGSANFYSFVRNNPTNFLDPFGLRPCTDEWLDKLQLLLDLAGLVPGIGEFFDLANAGIYGLRGDALNAGLSLASAIPILGWGGTAGKLGGKAIHAAEEVALEPKRIYSARELIRRAEEAGPFHNFPESFNDAIFKGERRVVSDSYVTYTQRGVVNGTEGTFEIGVRPSASGRTEVITHRFFRPDK
jgi:RHS repeat-associated protein